MGKMERRSLTKAEIEERQRNGQKISRTVEGDAYPTRLERRRASRDARRARKQV